MGGKSRAADVIWRGLGADVVNYVEPFAGSIAVLLGRPGGAGKIETVNDLSGAICNFWRAVKADPDAVAEWCDDPVSELDLHARHAWLVVRLEEMAEQLRADPEYYDSKVAGWWVWGICQWIGTGWCDAGMLERNAGARPHVSGDHAGMGVLSQKLPNLSGYDVGIRNQKQQIPFLAVPSGERSGAASGKGVHSERGLPAIGNDRGINGVAAPPCRDWFRALQRRLRRVRVVCGDWTRVLGPSVLGKGKNVGGRRPCAVFLDAPYDVTLRARNIYGHDRAGLAAEVRDWAVANGDDPDLRICLAGYFDEHAEHMPSSWTVHRWKGARGYASDENDNREQETLWFSPHCLDVSRQRELFPELRVE
jgi:hypothetical protein